ncbi:DUF5331 domain-containing protein [Anabaena subtropica]|uniref:DUF5331 domain-containing protein n=1 Tax=Anabaena subtropica FACHB-260 TaxID=2692884 RepID=A0ABR8CK51_9NOST|nr:DUF5331 domain-containing protein [Anabaena subtropica]MBD2343208.1 hypothetical protein [Anabaena subtropica FACHB-260]
MDIQELRQSLKMKWLSYYEQNRSWLAKMRVWATYNGLRRPSSGFILATLSVLEPQFEQILGFIMELNNDPDEIVAALGLNFNPDAELGLTTPSSNQKKQQIESKPTLSNGLVPNTHHWESQPVLSLVQNPVHLGAETRKVDVTHEAEPTNFAAGNGSQAIGFNLSEVNAITPKGNHTHSQSHRWSPTNHRSSPSVTVEVPNKTKPLPSFRLALATETHHNGKTLRVLEITTKVPSQSKTLALPTLTREVTQNRRDVDKQTPAPANKVKSSPSSNASSLASWVDEFCQGTGCNQDEAISIHH